MAIARQKPQWLLSICVHIYTYMYIYIYIYIVLGESDLKECQWNTWIRLWRISLEKLMKWDWARRLGLNDTVSVSPNAIGCTKQILSSVWHGPFIGVTWLTPRPWQASDGMVHIHMYMYISIYIYMCIYKYKHAATGEFFVEVRSNLHAPRAQIASCSWTE